MKGNEIIAFCPHSVYKFFAHFLNWISKSQGMIIYSTPQLLQVSIQLVCKSVVKLRQLNHLHRTRSTVAWATHLCLQGQTEKQTLINQQKQIAKSNETTEEYLAFSIRHRLCSL